MPDTNPVIVATDGSDHSLRVLPHAASLAAHLGAGIELVHVIEQADIYQEPGESETAAIERARSRLERELTDDLQRFGLDGAVRVIVAPDKENPDRTLLGIASRGLMLAMHSRGRGGIARLLHGSVALGVLRDIDRPVLLGGPDLLPPAASDSYRVLATTDLSPDSEQALRVLAPILAPTGIKVTLLYVHFRAPAGVDNEAERARHEAELAGKRLLLAASTEVDTMVREIPIGAGVDTAIMEVAGNVGAQAIAMSTHGHSARHHVLMGSVALSIVGRSRLPVIVVRAKDPGAG